jgi:hypothetical protein
VYVDPTIWDIQRAIFPTYPVLPVKLDDLERLLDDAEQHVSLQAIVAEMHESLIQFRDYADAAIQQVHHSMRESAGRRGYVYRYTSMDLVLLEQLGLDRQDREIRQQAAATAVESDPEVKEMLKAFFAAQTEEKLALAALHKSQIVEPAGEQYVPADYPNERTMMADPLEGYSGYGGQSGYSGFSGEVTNATPEGQEQMAAAMADTEPPAAVTSELDCVCGKQAGSKAGLLAHQRHCEKFKAQ